MGIDKNTNFSKLKNRLPILFCLPLLFNQSAFATTLPCSGQATAGSTVSCPNAGAAVDYCSNGNLPKVNATLVKDGETGMPVKAGGGLYFYTCGASNPTSGNNGLLNSGGQVGQQNQPVSNVVPPLVAPPAAPAPAAPAAASSGTLVTGTSNVKGSDGNWYQPGDVLPSGVTIKSLPAPVLNNPAGEVQANTGTAALGAPGQQPVNGAPLAIAADGTPQVSPQAAAGAAALEAQTAASSRAANAKLNYDQQVGTQLQSDLTQAQNQYADVANTSTDPAVVAAAQKKIQDIQSAINKNSGDITSDQSSVNQLSASNRTPNGTGSLTSTSQDEQSRKEKADALKQAKADDSLNANTIRANTFTPSNEDCALSANAGGTSCSGMRTTMATTQIAAQVASQIGSQAVKMIGQQSQQNAILSGGSIASIYQSSAQLSAKAAEANIGMGTVQLGMGILINHQADQHSKEYKNVFQKVQYDSSDEKQTAAQKKAAQNSAIGTQSITIQGSGADADVVAKVFNDGVQGNTGGAANSGGTSNTNNNTRNGNNQTSRNSNKSSDYGLDQKGMDAKTDIATINNVGGDEGPKTMQAKESAAVGSAMNYAHAASVEQKTASVDGHAAAVTNIAQGGGAVVSGTFQYLQAKQMEKLYAAMANAPTVTAPGADPFAAPGAISGSNTITGSGTDGNTAAATAATAPAPASSGGPLGAPLGNAPTGPAFGTPTDPGAAAAANTPSSGGAPLSAGGGVGTNAVPGSATDEKTAQYDASRNAAAYEGVGGFAPGTGGGGKGNSNDPSIDPKTLMAAMLDQMGQKKEDENGVGIENFRTIASDTNAPMPAEENFFKRFNDDYQEFQRKGQVGL